MNQWTRYYESFLIENRLDNVNTYREEFQSNENFQIIIEELRRTIKTKKNESFSGPGEYQKY